MGVQALGRQPFRNLARLGLLAPVLTRTPDGIVGITAFHAFPAAVGGNDGLPSAFLEDVDAGLHQSPFIFGIVAGLVVPSLSEPDGYVIPAFFQQRGDVVGYDEGPPFELGYCRGKDCLADFLSVDVGFMVTERIDVKESRLLGIRALECGIHDGGVEIFAAERTDIFTVHPVIADDADAEPLRLAPWTAVDGHSPPAKLTRKEFLS